jgi:type IX secretion system PorP/SprF family membrane protein
MKRIIKTLFCLLIPLCLSGQLTPVTNQYVLNPVSINPAYAGSNNALNIAAFYRRQWIGIIGAPETMTLSTDAPLSDGKIGLGLMIVNDKIGVTKETQFNTSYAYKIDIGEGILSFGLGAGVITTNTAWSDLTAIDPGDEFYLIDSRIFVVPNFSFGVYYSYKNYFAGFSIPKFLSYKFNFDKNKYGLVNDPTVYTYMLNTGYLFKMSQKIKFLPSTLISYSGGGKILYDLNANMNFFERFWIGVSYRDKRSLTAFFQFHLNNQLKMAYSYDFDISKLGRYSNGSHEIMLRYEFRYKVDVVNPLVF